MDGWMDGCDMQSLSDYIYIYTLFDLDYVIMHNIFKGYVYIYIYIQGIYIYICDWKWIFNLLYMLSFNPSIKFHMGTECSLVRLVWWSSKAVWIRWNLCGCARDTKEQTKFLIFNKANHSHLLPNLEDWSPSMSVTNWRFQNKHPTLKRALGISNSYNPLTIDAIDLENCRRKSSVFPNCSCPAAGQL